MDWKDRALKAADEKAAQEAEQRRQREAEEHERQIGAFQVALSTLLGEEVTVEGLESTIDGVTFCWQSARIGSGRYLAMKATCPTCGEDVTSAAINSLADVGALLQQFSPDPKAHNPVLCLNSMNHRADRMRIHG